MHTHLHKHMYCGSLLLSCFVFVFVWYAELRIVSLFFLRFFLLSWNERRNEVRQGEGREEVKRRGKGVPSTHC